MNLSPASYSSQHSGPLSVSLTGRERDILKLMTDGLTNGEIAERLVVTLETVKWYAKQIYSKLNAHGRDEAVQIARDRRLLAAALGSFVETEPDSLSYVPLPSTPLVGRERELAEVCDYLRGEAVRLVTLIGPPGIGKTRLSLHTAAALKDHFADGAFFVGLAAITDPLHVPGAIAGVLNLNADGPIPQLLKNNLRRKHLLLVLDNFEQIMNAVPFVGELLEAAPRLRLLVSSREVLRLSGEQQYLMQPLAVPDSRTPIVTDDLSKVASVDLFVQRARAVKHTFALTEENAPILAQLCARLEGVPLAIELAAARIKMLSPADLLAGLGSRLNLLKSNLRDRTSRQQTLRGALDWSYALLNDDEKRLFMRMGVFQGGCTLEAANIVGGAGLDMETVDGVESLVNKSLLTIREDTDGEPHFTMLEMICEYALEKLSEAGELDAMQQAHVHYYAALVTQAEHHWHTPEQIDWLDKLEHDIDNLRAVLTWSLAHDVEVAGQMAAQLWVFWAARGYFTEGHHWYDWVLKRGEMLSPALKARILEGAGTFAIYLGDPVKALAYHKEAERFALVADDDLTRARVLVSRAFFEEKHGSAATAQDYAERTIQIARADIPTTPMQRNLAEALARLGTALIQQDHFEAGKARLYEAYEVREAMGDFFGMTSALYNLAQHLLQWGEQAEAERLFKKAATLAQEHRLYGMMGALEGYLAYLALWKGDYYVAVEHGEIALTLLEKQNDRRQVECARILGCAYQMLGDKERPAVLLRKSLDTARSLKQPNDVAFALTQAALLLLETDKGSRTAHWLGTTEAVHTVNLRRTSLERDQYQKALEAFRARLGDQAFEAALVEGRTLSLDQAADEALSLL